MLTQHGVGFRAIIRSTAYNQLTVLVHSLCRCEQHCGLCRKNLPRKTQIYR